jgi:hypothetical protein
MPEKIFDPEVHQDLEHLEGFRFRHTVLAESITEFKANNEKYRDATGPTIAALTGLAESTLKKLRTGQIFDPRGSTYWLLWKAFNIDPRRLMGIPVSPPPASKEPGQEIKALIEGKEKHIADLEAGLAKRERMIVRRNWVIVALVAVMVALFVLDLAVPAGWLNIRS